MLTVLKLDWVYTSGDSVPKEPEPDDDMCKCPCHRGESIFCSCWISCCEMPFATWRRKNGSINWVRYNLLRTRMVRGTAWMKKRGYSKEERGECRNSTKTK